jgi:hypothetical protein
MNVRKNAEDDKKIGISEAFHRRIHFSWMRRGYKGSEHRTALAYRFQLPVCTLFPGLHRHP